MNKEFKIGIVTLGQSPRKDIEPTLYSILGRSTKICQVGGLDNLSAEEIHRLTPSEGEDGIETCIPSEKGLVEGVLISKNFLLPRLIAAANYLETGCDHFFLLCSGHFPALKKAVPAIIEPIVIIRSVVEALAGNRHLCVIGPESDMKAAPAQWAPYVSKVSTSAASPYGGRGSLVQAADRAKRSRADFILMDDMGFTEEQRKLVHEISGIPTLGAVSITARVLKELL